MHEYGSETPNLILRDITEERCKQHPTEKDLEEVCEQQDEVTGSDDGNANDVFAATPKINKTRRELTVLLNQAKHELDNSEKGLNQLEQLM
ncbi:hypothetical protein MAR_035682 [Mya arenaria]|uniref:Uncharacterized protein n=1 Tax=Mya arenaria TaxID=6604 RepID=A0ABY7EP79_MYAAR|nr:hypothetical protein MAR_035682 [Mya arenaria]